MDKTCRVVLRVTIRERERWKAASSQGRLYEHQHSKSLSHFVRLAVNEKCAAMEVPPSPRPRK